MRAYPIVREIVKNLQLILWDAEEDREFREKYIKNNGRDYLENCSFIYGSDEIVLGLYDNPEWKLVSFFHEVGHIFVTRKYMEDFHFDSEKIERQAWEIGYAIAASYGIFFSDETKAWAKEQEEGHKIVAYRCCRCGRWKFQRRTPHICNGQYRKRGLTWEGISKKQYDANRQRELRENESRDN